MPLTRIWTVLLAVLATGCVAGMLLLSAGSSGMFADANRNALRAVSEASLAALAAEIASSPVNEVSQLALDDRLRRAVELDIAGRESDLGHVLAESSETLRVRTASNLTVAVIGPRGEVLAANGVFEAKIPEVLATRTYRSLAPTEGRAFSTAIDGQIYVAKATPTWFKDFRLVAFDALNLGAGSMLRRVLGSKTPAGIVHKGALAGSVLGDQPVREEIVALALAHARDVPDDGASAVWSIGEGLDRRIGVLGRVPGPAGEGPDGALLVVMSRETAAASQRNIAAAIGAARSRGVELNWLVLGGLLLVSTALGVYLPHLEAVGPLRRLAREFDAVAVGQQPHVAHDRYAGAVGQTARSAAEAYEALRNAFLAELELEGEGLEGRAAARGPASGRAKALRPEPPTRPQPKLRPEADLQTPTPPAPDPKKP